MILSENESSKFYQLWFQLLTYVNYKYKILPNINLAFTSKGVDMDKILLIRNYLWDNDNILEEVYLNNPLNLNQEDLEILISWRKRVIGRLVILKHLKKYTVMMSEDNIYGVLGIVSPLEEMYPNYTLPILTEAVLIPFEDKIIYDGILLPYNFNFRSGAKKIINENYQKLKALKGIINSL